MRSLTNIEPSAFRRGEYVGYSNGVWRITRAGSGWYARHRDDANRPSISADTLEQLSERLKLTPADAGHPDNVIL